MSDRTIELDGQTNFARNGVGGYMHRTRITIASGQVETVVEGFGPGCQGYDPVTSRHPAVERYAREIDRALQVTAYRNRPITSIQKPPRRRSRVLAPELCPACGSRPNEVETCDQCDGSGLVHSGS